MLRPTARIFTLGCILLGFLLLAASCSSARRGGGGGGDDDSAANDDVGGPGDTDSDGDGLSDAEEEDIGTDPDEEDTDEDGWTDGEEVDGFADPLDEDDHPYAGGWPRGPIPADLKSTGNDVGDIAQDFVLMDQFGENVRLWSFYGLVIMIENAAEW